MINRYPKQDFGLGVESGYNNCILLISFKLCSLCKISFHDNRGENGRVAKEKGMVTLLKPCQSLTSRCGVISVPALQSIKHQTPEYSIGSK